MRVDRIMDRTPVATVPHIPVTIDENNIIQNGALDILRVVRPTWSSTAIKSKVFTDGLSNKLVGFYVQDNPEDMVIVKVYGSNTGKLIDRKAEIETMRTLHERNCGAQLYATFMNGISYEYMNGSTLEVEDCSRPEIFELIATEMAHMHSFHPNQNNNNNENYVLDKEASNGDTNLDKNKNGIKTVPVKLTSQLWQKIQQFNKLAEESMKNDPELRQRLSTVGVTSGWAAGAISQLKQLIEREQIPITFCHNDLISRNIVYDPKRKRVTFIDVEYAMLNYPSFDVANHFLEFAGVPERLDYSKYPDKEFRLRWISEYLKHLRLEEDDVMTKKITPQEFSHWVDLCTPASHLFWGLWAIHQARHSTIKFDYVQYVGKRFAEYKKCMNSLLHSQNGKV